MLRVVLVEDFDDLRATLCHALRLHGGFDVVADVADGASAIAATAKLCPDVIVLDLGLPDLAGTELVTRVREASPNSRIVIYTGAVIPDGAGLDVHAVVSKDKGVRYLMALLADLERVDHRHERIVLGPNTGDVLRARRFVSNLCEEWDCASVAPSALLVVSELVTNALLHASGTCELRVRVADQVMRIEVHDRGIGTPDVQIADQDAEGGRGMLIVSALSEAWGVESSEAHKMVWAELTTSAA